MFGRRSQYDFEDEIRSHIAMEVERLRGQGMTLADAERIARRSFGNVGIIEDRFYQAQRFSLGGDADSKPMKGVPNALVDILPEEHNTLW